MGSTLVRKSKDKEENNRSASSSYYQKTVCLQDWWLIKAEKDFEGRRIAVAGMTPREQFAVRMFSSAPILKTYDGLTLETVDGVCVVLKGHINKGCTEENGFSSEVFKHFVFAFPPDWKRCAERCLVGGSSIKDTSRIVGGSSNEGAANSTLTCDKLSTDSGNMDNLHEETPDRNVSTNNLGGNGNNDEMGQGSENFAAIQTHIESSPATPVVAHVDDLHEATPDRKETTNNSGRYDNKDEMDQGLENFTARQTQIGSSPATPVAARVDDFLHEATPDRQETTNNSGRYDNKDEMDQGLENFTAGQTQIGSSPATPVVAHVDDLHKTTPDRNISTSNSGGYGTNDELGQGLENFAAGQTQIDSLPATPVVAPTEIHEVREEVLGSTMKSPNSLSSSEAGNGNNATSNTKRQKSTGSESLCCHEKIVKASRRCSNYKNMVRSPPPTDHENLDGEKMNDAVAALTARSVMKKCNLEELSCSEGRMDVFSFGSSMSRLNNDKNVVNLVTREKGNVKSVSKSTYRLRSATVYGDGKSGQRGNFTQPEVQITNTVDDRTLEQMPGNKASQTGKPRTSTRKTLTSSIGIGDVSQKYNEQNTADRETSAEDLGRYKKKTKRRLALESPVVQEKEVHTPSHPTESVSFKRSRSGRLLLPSLEFWRNQRAVYDAEHKVTAVLEGLDHEEPSRGTRSEPQRKRGRV